MTKRIIDLPAIRWSAGLFCLALVFVAWRIFTPSDGTRLEPGEVVRTLDGVSIALLDEQPGNLESGDVVAAIDGRPYEAWAEALFAVGLARPAWRAGDAHAYRVIRNGAVVDVPVTLAAFPFGAALLEHWGEIAEGVLSVLLLGFIVLRRPDSRPAGVLFFWATAGLAYRLIHSLEYQVGDVVQGTGLWLYVAGGFTTIMMSLAALVHFGFLFPKPLAILNRRGLVPLIYGAPMISFVILVGVAHSATPNILDWLRLWRPLSSVHILFYTLLFTGMTIARFFETRQDSMLHQQQRLILFSGIVLVGFDLALVRIPRLLLAPRADPNVISLLQLLFPLALATAVLRYRLFDIDLFIRRALVYGTLTTLVAAVYVLVVGGLGSLLRMNVSAAGFVLASLLSLLLIQPARARLQRGVDRVMYGPSSGSGRGSEPELPPQKRDPGERRRERAPAGPVGALSPLDIFFRVLAVLGTVEVAALAYRLAVYPNAAGIVGQPYFERVLLGLLVAPLVLAIGAFLLWRVPGNIVPRFILLFGLFGVMGQFDIDLNVSSSATLPAILFMIVGAGLVAPSLGYLMMHFPNGRLYPAQFVPWLRLIAGAKFAGVVLEVLATPGDIKVFRIGVNPLYVPSLAPYQLLIAPTIGITGILLPAIMVGGMLSLLLRFRASPPAERAQIQWVIGGFAGLLAAMLAGVVFVFSGGPGSVAAVGVLLLVSAAMLCFVVSVAVAIARYRLYGIEQVVNRALVYGTLTICVAGFYVVVVGSVSTLLQTGNNLVISLLATGLIAVIFQPLRERLQRSVNRLLYGERDEPYIVLSRLGERLEATVPPDAMLRAIVESVATALKLPYVAIELADGSARQMTGEADINRKPSLSLAAVYGQTGAKTVSMPLNFQGETMGAMLLAPRVGEERFDDADLRLLNDLARQVGVAAHAVQLSADLQRSRERIVTAREEERRRIRRDLHDGLGPALAALTLKLDAARNLADRDAAATKTLLAELRGQTQAAISDIRRLVYDLRPPALDELGLVPALREYATRLTSDGLQITLEADTLPPLSAAAEVATYRIVTEALTNVVHHAHACHAQVHLSCTEMLRIEVTDDGAGLPPNVRAGVGLTSMRERAEELGGLCTIESVEGGGTRVTARLPV